jgi:dTMP kinase
MQQTERRPDRMEQQPTEFYEAVRKGYHELAKREPDRVVLIDGSQTPDKVDNQIWETILTRLPTLSKQIENRKSKI